MTAATFTPAGDTTSLCGWQYGKSLKDCIHHMLVNQIATDVCFKVGLPDGSAVSLVKAHKFILTCRSAVFEKLLTNQETSASDKIKVTDIEPAVFKEVLTYIYTDDATVTVATAQPLMSAARKYLLSGLLEICRQFIQERLTIDNVCTVMDQSLEFGETELKEHCVQLICSEADEVIKTKGFLALTANALEILVRDDTFTPGSDESDVHLACVKWATSQLHRQSGVNNPTDLQIREKLGPILYRIRYPTLSLEKFATTLCKSRLLLDQERLSILDCYGATEKDDSLAFDYQPRNTTRYQMNGSIDRFPDIVQGQWGRRACGEPVDAIQFKTDKDVTLDGFGLFPTQQEMALFGGQPTQRVTNINVQLGGIDISKTNVNIHEVQHIKQDGRVEKLIKVDLKQPIEIKSGFEYTVWMSGQQYMMYGQNGKVTCVDQGVTFTFSNSPMSTAGSTVQSGQIPQLFFKCKKYTKSLVKIVKNVSVDPNQKKVLKACRRGVAPSE